MKSTVHARGGKIVSAAMVVIIALVIWKAFFSDESERSNAALAESEQAEQEASASIATNQRRMRLLEKRIALMELKIAEMEAALTKCGAEAIDSSEKVPEKVNDSPNEGLAWNEEEVGEAENPEARLTTLMASEYVDNDWSERIKGQFDELAYDTVLSRASLLSTDCRETVCRISIEFDSAQALENALPDLGFLATAGEQSTFAMNENTPERIDYYLQRTPSE